MFHFKKKKEVSLNELVPFDQNTQIPIIKSSICTGEKVAGFKNKKDHHFKEVMLIQNDNDLKLFMDSYHITDIKEEY